MILIDEVNEANVFQIDLDEFITALHSIKRDKEEEIQLIKDKIIKYEEKRRVEDAMYRSLSPIKKLFTSRAPSHHQAVEYMVYVKERFRSIERIKQNVSGIEKLISIVHSEPNIEKVFLSGLLMGEIIAWKEVEVRLSEY